MKPPMHLTRLEPAATFRYIAAWAENAAELYDELESEYDLGSERAVFLRNQIIECAAHIFGAIVVGHPEARWRLARGLDRAQRTIGPDVAPWPASEDETGPV